MLILQILKPVRPAKFPYMFFNTGTKNIYLKCGKPRFKMSYLYKDVPTIRHYNLVTKLTFLKGIRLHNSYFIKIEIVSVKAYSEL